MLHRVSRRTQNPAGDGGAISQRALGNAAITAVTVAAEMSAFGNVSETTHVTPSELMQYTWWDQAMRLAAKGGARAEPLHTVTVADTLYPRVRTGWTTRG